MATSYPSVAAIKSIHQDQIERYGGSHGIRDEKGLESAVARPQTGYYTDIIAEAAALMESLAVNHPFIDGNKRAAFAAVHYFLGVNGVEITAEPMDIYRRMIALFESGNFKFDALEKMLRDITA